MAKMTKKQAIEAALLLARSRLENGDVVRLEIHPGHVGLTCTKSGNKFPFEPEHQPCPLCGGELSVSDSARVWCNDGECGYTCPKRGYDEKDAWNQHDHLAPIIRKAVNE